MHGMTPEQQIARITEIINENDFAEVTKAKFEEAFNDMSIREIKETIWELYRFMSDIVDTINM